MRNLMNKHTRVYSDLYKFVRVLINVNNKIFQGVYND